MHKRKLLAWLLSLTLTVAAASVGFGRAAAAESPDWSAATDGVLGQYIAADSVPAGSLITGKIPTVGTTDTAWEVKSGSAAADKLTDGQFCTTAADRVLYELWKHDYTKGSWAAFTFTLDAATEIDRFLIGSEPGQAQYLTDVRVYVSDALETLYEDTNKVAEVTEVTLGNYFIRGTAKTGRYVGFTFLNPCGYWSAPWYGEIRFGELAVYGSTALDWSDATPVTKGYVQAAEQAESNSRIAGLLPTRGITGEQWTADGGELTWLTDGALIQTNNANRVQLNLNPTVPAGQWAQLTFDTGAVVRFTHFLIGSEAGKAQYLTDVKVYVSKELAELYSDTSLVAEATGVQLGNYFIRGDETVGQYVGFAFKNPGGFWSAPWYGMLRIGELAAYGTAETEEVPWSQTAKGFYRPAETVEANSQIAGKLPAIGSTGEQWAADAGELAWLTDGVLVQADNANRVQLNLNPTVPAGQWAQLTFDTEAIVGFTHFLIGSEYGAQQYLKNVRVYVGFDRETLYQEKHLVAEAADVTAGNYQLKGEPAYGRYVGFAFKNPGGFWSAPWYGLLRIGELAAYGAASGQAPTDGVRLNDTADVDKLPTGDNLLRGLTPRTTGGAAIEPETPVANATDGIIVGITQEREAPNTGLNNGMVYEKTPDNVLVYDLGVDAQLTHILLAANTWDREPYWIYEADVFIGDTLVELLEQPAIHINFQHSIGMVLALPENTVGRYVAFRIPVQSHWYSRVRIGEIGAFGTLLGDPQDPNAAVNLLAGKTPMEAYICERGMPDKYHEEANGYLHTFTWTESAMRLTDGRYDTRCSWYNHALDGRQHGNYIDTDSPWTVLIYYLGGTANINEILLTSTAEKGLYLGGADFYVGTRLTELFAPENRVYASGGEKTVTDDAGNTVLDPATDVRKRCMRVTFSQPRQGRYVAIVVTRAHASDVLGYGVCRVNEIEVFGTLPANRVETFPNTTFRDAATGYTLTLNPLNNDDRDIYTAISHLEVQRFACPDSLLGTWDDGWLRVDPTDTTVYEFRLIKQDGSVMTAEEYGDRRLDVYMTNESGHSQGLGAIQGDTVVRVVNSRTDGQNTLIGEAVPSLQLVRLVYSDGLTQRCGVAGGSYTETQVAGAAQKAAPGAVAMFGILSGAIVVMTGAGVLSLRRKRKGGARG